VFIINLINNSNVLDLFPSQYNISNEYNDNNKLYYVSDEENNNFKPKIIILKKMK